MQVVWVGSPNYTPGRAGHNPNWTAADPNTWIVDHTTVSYRDAAASRFTSSAGEASPTYMVDRDGTIYQYVRETDAPWTNGTMQGIGSNLDSITIEHVDDKQYNGPYPEVQIQASAELHADISRRRGIPLVHRGQGGGVLGHKECTGASTACPDGLPVDEIIRRANLILHPPAPVPAPPPVTPPAPDTRPEWERNLAPAPMSFSLLRTVPVISLSDGTGHAGTVPVGPLVVAFETRAYGQDWWVTDYGRQHGHGLLKSDVAVAIKPLPIPPEPTPAPPPIPPPDPTPTPAPIPPPPVVPPGHNDSSFASWIIGLADHELVALVEWVKEHLAKR